MRMTVPPVYDEGHAKSGYSGLPRYAHSSGFARLAGL